MMESVDALEGHERLLNQAVFERLVQVCEEDAVLVMDVLRGRRTAAAAQARGHLVARLRSEIWHRQVGLKTVARGGRECRLRLLEFMLVAEDAVAVKRTGWTPLSYPIIGRLLGLDHSGAIYAHRAWKAPGRARRGGPRSGLTPFQAVAALCRGPLVGVDGKLVPIGEAAVREGMS